MFDDLFLLLGILFFKHWFVDFVNQSQEEIDSKGIYGNWVGLVHSIKHGVLTAFIFGTIAQIDWPSAVVVGVVDTAIHYHIDWAKNALNNSLGYTIQMSQYWALFGLDQLAHALTYLFLVWCII